MALTLDLQLKKANKRPSSLHDIEGDLAPHQDPIATSRGNVPLLVVEE